MEIRPKVSSKEIVEEIRNRTLLPKDAIRAVIDTYCDIIQEAILADCECNFGNIGYFSFFENKPKENVEYFNFQTKKREIKELAPGFKRLVFRTKPTWKANLRALSLNYEIDKEKE